MMSPARARAPQMRDDDVDTFGLGFGDSARALERESKADRLDEHYKAQVRPGQLIYLIQRGLQYEELRTSLEKVLQRRRFCRVVVLLVRRRLTKDIGWYRAARSRAVGISSPRTSRGG